MSLVTIKFHESLIRCCKGIIVAWELWLNEQKNEQKEGRAQSEEM